MKHGSGSRHIFTNIPNTNLQIVSTKYYVIKFGLSEKHTKFEKVFLMVLTNQLIYLVSVKTMRKIFQIMRASQKFRTLFVMIFSLAQRKKKPISAL